MHSRCLSYFNKHVKLILHSKVYDHAVCEKVHIAFLSACLCIFPLLNWSWSILGHYPELCNCRGCLAGLESETNSLLHLLFIYWGQDRMQDLFEVAGVFLDPNTSLVVIQGQCSTNEKIVTLYVPPGSKKTPRPVIKAGIVCIWMFLYFKSVGGHTYLSLVDGVDLLTFFFATPCKHPHIIKDDL